MAEDRFQKNVLGRDGKTADERKSGVGTAREAPKEDFIDFLSEKTQIPGVFKAGPPEEFIEASTQAQLQGRPVQAALNEALYATQKTGKELLAAPAAAFNQLFANAPRSLTETFTPFAFPSQTETGAGNVLEKAFGLMGLVSSPIFRGIEKVGGSVFKKGVGGSPILAGLGNIGKATGKGALKGAAAGAVISPTDFKDIGARLKNAGMGFVFGGLLGATGAAALATQRGKQQFVDKGKIKDTSARIKATGQRLEKIAKDRGALTKQTIRNAYDNQIDDVTTNINKNIQVYQEQLDDAITHGSQEYQRRLPDFARSTFDSYGSQLDDISTSIAKSNTPLFRSEIDDIINKTLLEADDMALPAGKIRGELIRLRNKWGIQAPTEQTSALLGPTGQPIAPIITPGVNDKIPFLNAHLDFRGINKLFAPASKEGRKALADSELIGILFKRHWGQMISKKLNNDKFSNLQQTYSQFAEAMKIARKAFKPKSSLVPGEAGRRLTEKLATAGKGTQEAQVRGLLEKGTVLGKGVGKVSEPVTRATERLAGAERGLKETTKALKGAKRTAIQTQEQKTAVEIGRLSERILAKSRDAGKFARQKEIAFNLKRALFNVSKVGAVAFALKALSEFTGKIGEAFD